MWVHEHVGSHLKEVWMDHIPMPWEAIPELLCHPGHEMPPSHLWEDSARDNNNTAKSLQLCPTLCDPMDCSPPGFSIPGILQARTLEWVAISFSNARKWKVKLKSLSRVRLLATSWTAAYQAPPSMGFSRQEYWTGVPLPSLNNNTHKTKSRTRSLFKQNRKIENNFIIQFQISGDFWGKGWWRLIVLFS